MVRGGYHRDGPWSSFLLTNTVWGVSQGEWGSGVIHRSFSVPASGTYTIHISVDNAGTVAIDGNTVPNLVNVGYNYDSTSTIDLAQGTHTIDLSYADVGDSYGAALAIYNNAGNEIWNLKKTCLQHGG